MIKLIAIVFFLMASSPANAFLVTDFEGKRIDVKDYIGDGRWTVVMLWQLNCVPCELHKPVVEAFHQKHKASNAHVLGLVLDGHEYMPQIQQFVDKQPTVFPSLVVFGDVFSQQIKEETGKHFPAAPGYIVYAPDGAKIEVIQEIDEAGEDGQALTEKDASKPTITKNVSKKPKSS